MRRQIYAEFPEVAVGFLCLAKNWATPSFRFGRVLTAAEAQEKRAQDTMDYRGPFSTIPKPGKACLFPSGRTDFERPIEKNSGWRDGPVEDRTVSDATRYGPERKKPTNRNSWSSW